MRRLVLSLILALFAGSASADPACSGADCSRYNNTVARSKIPYTGPLICLHYVQAARDKVVMRFVKDGADIHTVSNETGPRDSFCFGRWRLTRNDMRPDEIWICNGEKSARLVAKDISLIIKHAGTPPGESVCLLGSLACKGKALTEQ